ncbi:MAG: hypothetical protein ACFFGZ_20015 [Candidatus Thorarchaeota archaeon]
MTSVLGLINGLGGEVETLSDLDRGSNNAIIFQENVPALHKSSLNWTILQYIQQQPQVKAIFPHQLSIATIRDPLSRREIQVEVFGLNLSQIMQFHSKIYIAEGELASMTDSNECMLGALLAKKLGIEESYPANVTIRTETPLNVNVKGIFENAGRYASAILTSHQFFEVLFPNQSSHLSFVEVSFQRGSRSDENVLSVQTALTKEGYSCEVIAERGQNEISKQLFSDSLTVFWAFSLAAFVIVALQVHFVTKWIGMHFVTEFQILRELGMTRARLTLMLLFMTLILGNLAFIIAILISLPLGTASLALLTLFSGTSRFYAGVQLSDLIVLFVLTNLTTLLGSFYQVWAYGMKKNLTLEALR